LDVLAGARSQNPGHPEASQLPLLLPVRCCLLMLLWLRACALL
jgi:hypothetical protein